MGIINEEMEPGEGPAHEQAEPPPVEQQEGQAEAAGMPEQDGMGEDDPTPEEEDAYEKGVIAIMRTLYDSGAADDIVDSAVKAGGDPDSIAKATMQLMRSIDEATGGQIPETVLALWRPRRSRRSSNSSRRPASRSAAGGSLKHCRSCCSTS